MNRKFEQFSVEGGRWIYRKPYLQERGGKKRWRVRRRDTKTGIVEQLTLEASSLREAKEEVIALATKEKAVAEEAKKTPKEKRLTEVTLEQALDQWGSTLEVREVTLHRYFGDLKLFKVSLGSQKYVHEVSLTDLENLFFRSWKNTKGARTRIKHLKLLIRFFDWCVDHIYCVDNLARKLKVPVQWRKEAKKAARSKGKALTFKEAQRLLEACEQPFTLEIWNGYSTRQQEFKPPSYLHLFVLIGLRTGLRRSNILGLKWGDIDLEKKTLNIEASRMKNDLDFEVPLHDELVEALRKQLFSLGRVPSRQEPVLDIIEPHEGFKAALKRCGLDSSIRIHDLRHTFATWLGEHCTHSVMQRLMGHAPASMTDHYAKHQDMEVLRKGLNRLPWLTERRGQDTAVEGR